MTELERLQHEVSVLPVSDRAELASFLLGSLDQGHHWVDDDDVNRRFSEGESGAAKGLTLEESRAIALNEEHRWGRLQDELKPGMEAVDSEFIPLNLGEILAEAKRRKDHL